MDDLQITVVIVTEKECYRSPEIALRLSRARSGLLADFARQHK